MTSAASSYPASADKVGNAFTVSATPSSAFTKSSPLPAVPAQLNQASYANATKPIPSTSATTTSSSISSAATGASAPVQHGKVDINNSKSQMSTTSPSVGSQQGNANSNTNGITQNNDHGRKPSVVISAQGASGSIANGGPVGQNARHNISFGSIMNPQESPASSNSVPFQSQNSNLPTPRQDPRITSPAHSPSPIPQPHASGGKPTLPGQANGLNFGSMGAENGDSRGPLTPGQQPAHLRRESSQSAHSDMASTAMPNMGRGFQPQNNRGGRGGFMPQYGGNHSPAQSYRQMSNPRGPPNMGQQFPGQSQMNNSPYRGRNSPAMMHAQPHMPHNMPQSPSMPYGGYPQHLNPQQQNMYGMQPQFDPYSGYYQPQYYGHQQYPAGAPPSPRPGQQYPAPYSGGPPQHIQSPYQAPNMSRSASQVSERPASALGSRPPTNASAMSQAGNSTPTSATTPAPQTSNFQIPSRVKSKAIVIKNAAGEEVHFDKNKKPSPSPAPVSQPPTPAIVSSTPPPRTPSTASAQHIRTESKSAKTDAEIKNGFQEQVKRQLEAQREKERKDREGADQKASDDKSTEDAKVESDKAEKEQAEQKAESDKAEKEKAESDKAEKEKAEADKIASDKAEAEAKATAEKEKLEAEAKATAEKEKSEAEAKATAEKEKLETEAKEAKDKSDAEAAAQADNARAVTESEKAAPAESEEDEEARKKREEDERIEAEIAEMEAAEKEEEERERKFQEKRAVEKEAQKKRDAEKAANADEEMKRLEREAEALELAKEKEREQPSEESSDAKADKDLFESLKKPTLGPGATESAEPAAEEAPAVEDTPAAPRGLAKTKPNPLKLQTDKPVEPAAPTPGMQSLRSARLLDVQRENNIYPEGIKSPNPALNLAGKKGQKSYDKSFLLQFQEVFKEKPAVDWDQKVKDTLGDGEPSSARAGPGGSRTPSSAAGRQNSRGAPSSSFGPMGSFSGPRTLPPNTTSADRFAASTAGGRPPPVNSMSFAGRPGGSFPMGSQPMGSRNSSLQPMASSPKGGASRGRGSRRGPDRAMSRKEEEQMQKAMPLTAGADLKPLEKGQNGWTARSIGQPVAVNPTPDGMMAPDVVQRKVKAALNKMTPEKFEKIADQVIEIANQSKNETDGRTLRQVIQLTFEKACDEAHWAGMYAKFCQKMLTSMSNEIVDETIRDKTGAPVVGGGLFRKYLLNRCQEEFERGWEANLPDKPDEDKEEAKLLSDEYYVAAAAKRRGLGLIQFIGELYKLSMLTYRIMHQCVLKLLNFEGQPDESTVENLCKLLRTIGATMDLSGEQGHGLVEAYFQRIVNVLDTHKDLPSRPRFMLMDIVDLRRSGWKDKSAQKGPKTIQEIHAEAEAAAAAAEAEKARQHVRGGPGGRPQAGRGDARNFGGHGHNMPPPDYPRNQVEMGDLRKLQTRNASSRQASSGLGPSLGPGSSLYAGRSTSGRKGLGPPQDGHASGATSRTSTPPAKKEDKESNSHANAFSALAALDAEGTDDAAPAEKASPQPTEATPSIDAAADSSAPPS